MSQKIAELLKDPQALAKIASIAGSLSDGKITSSVPVEEAPSVPAVSIPKASTSKAALLSALKPLLREDKQNKIDKLIRALSVASVFRNIKGGE